MHLLLQACLWLVATFVVFGVIVFGAAGSLAWTPGWVFLILLLVYSVTMIGNLYATNRDLLRDRLSLSQPHQDSRDRVLMPLLLLLFLAWFVLMPLDGARFHWSHVPAALQVIGAVVLMASLPVVIATFRENTFATTMVRVQQERGQRVISTGPYHVVRHPLYAGALLFLVGTPLLLSSWFGLLFALVLTVGLGARAVLEERVLRTELAGYDAYMAEVRYRFIPHVW